MEAEDRPTGKVQSVVKASSNIGCVTQNVRIRLPLVKSFFSLALRGHLKTWLIGESDYDSTHSLRLQAAMPP